MPEMEQMQPCGCHFKVSYNRSGQKISRLSMCKTHRTAANVGARLLAGSKYKPIEHKKKTT